MKLHRLDIQASFSFYKIDPIIQRRNALMMKLEINHLSFLVRKGREAFNVAARAADEARPNDDEFRAAKKATESFLEEVRKFGQTIQEADPEIISRVAIPTGELASGDHEWDALEVEDRFDDLRTAVERFLSDVMMPLYKSGAGNNDLFTRRYIQTLADDWRLSPFIPVTQDNWREFARLISAGWEDLGLPTAIGTSKGYPTVYGCGSCPDSIRISLH